MHSQYLDKTAVVVGASSGIGEGIARELANRGATVVLVARRAERLDELAQSIEQAGGKAAGFPCDVTDENSVRKLARSVGDEFGHVNLLVNNAGKMAWAPFAALEYQNDVKDLLELNVAANWYLTRCFAPLLPRGSAIVNMASAAGLQGTLGLSSYSASKGAVIAMTRSLARELAPRQVRVNAVAPGVVDTETARLKFNAMSKQQMEATKAQHPLGFGTPQDVAKAVAFLGSDEASWITGHTLVVDGGLTA